MDGLPDFLNRKLTPLEPATYEERMAFCPAPMIQAQQRNANEEAIKQEKKEKARERITKMKARLEEKSQTKDIPDEHLGWDAKNLRFYDRRVRRARKLKAARQRLGLE